MKNFLVKLCATGFGSGYMPLAPGTFGSAVGAFLYLLWLQSGGHYPFLLAALVIVFSVCVAHEAERIFREKDCQKIVIDEVAGQWVTYLFVAVSLQNMVVGFVLFRIFDVIKIFPARWIQDHVPGGAGIVGDDVAAGLQAGIVLYLLNHYIY